MVSCSLPEVVQEAFDEQGRLFPYDKVHRILKEKELGQLNNRSSESIFTRQRIVISYPTLSLEKSHC